MSPRHLFTAAPAEFSLGLHKAEAIVVAQPRDVSARKAARIGGQIGGGEVTCVLVEALRILLMVVQPR